ncbi:GtrA family protein [Cupriavidus neocaledonicus]|uniref:Membrane component, GtrA-like protein n=1 Tax=Cupriavidus neocaledonicus TaxID=1040979 RepID=A0A375H697_9BURK|nr:GtrA family protein [Cupriavidus neocaledonicus]SOZ37199.1 putative membrane component, GtrA-like protein [Cupriavidus neocaledonicus]SPD45777.1 putative membrane component, GtrA-like protein [Cupriavidus neocaledonicus]
MNPGGIAPGLRRFTRFAVSGATSTGVHVAITATLVSMFDATPVAANGVAFVSATLCSYLLNTLWSFSSRLHHHTLRRFAGVSLLGLALTVAIAWIAQWLGASYWAGLAGVVLTVPVFTYLLHRTWTYRD